MEQDESEKERGNGISLKDFGVNPKRENVPVVRELMAVAFQNLATAKDCLRAKRYPVYVEMLHAAFEKMIKAFGLCAGIVDEKDLASTISHNPQKIWIKMIELPLIQGMVEFMPEPQKLKDSMPKVKELSGKLERSLEMDKDIPALLGYYRKYKSDHGIVTAWPLFPYLFSFILSPHFSPSRYPTTKAGVGKVAPSFYTNDLNLVKYGGQIIKEAEEAFKQMREWIELLCQLYEKQAQNLTGQQI